jgi:hypothetical protein
MPPTPRTARVASQTLASDPLAAVLAPPAPAPPALPAEPEKVVDEEKEARIRYIVQQLASMVPEKDVLRGVMVNFEVRRDQAVLDYADARDSLRLRLDDEGTIDAVAYGALARIHVTQETFLGIALKPIRTKVREISAPMPDDVEAPYDPDGPGATYRDLTPGEYSSEVGARVAAGKLALQANELLVKIAGRRSTRWHDRPQNVIVQASGNGFTPDESEFLKSIGVLK